MHTTENVGKLLTPIPGTLNQGGVAWRGSGGCGSGSGGALSLRGKFEKEEFIVALREEVADDV